MQRATLRDQVHDEVLRQLVEGELGIGEDIDELALAAQLGVSRTPIREALLRLAERGLVENRPRRGFFVTSVTVDDAREVYPMIAALEVLALRSADPSALDAAIPELEDANEQLADAHHDARAAQAADDRWHAALVRTAGNRRLVETLTGLKTLVNRYEHAYMGDADAVAVSVGQHRLVATALRTGDLDRAAEVLDQNWRHGLDRFLGYLRHAETPRS